MHWLDQTPQGAFVFSQAPERSRDASLLSVQCGDAICIVQVGTEIYNSDGKEYLNLPGTPHYFGHIYDLVNYTQLQPLQFSQLEQPFISLSIPACLRGQVSLEYWESSLWERPEIGLGHSCPCCYDEYYFSESIPVALLGLQRLRGAIKRLSLRSIQSQRVQSHLY